MSDIITGKEQRILRMGNQLNKAEDSIALKEYWMNREELIKEFN